MGVAPSSKAHGLPEGDNDVNLIPVMGLIMILIPLLLYSFSFFDIRMQPVEAPKTGVAGPGSDKGDKDQKPLNLTVIVGTPGFAIKMDAEVVGQENADINIPKKMLKSPYTGKRILEYDYPGLYLKLYDIKKKFKEETTLHLTASPDIEWGIITRVMDASRFILKKKKFTGLDDFSTAEVDTEEQGDENVPRLLFPQVIFVVMN